MKILIFCLCYLLIAAYAYSEDISGTWYRNLDSAEGVLTINDNLEFSIEVEVFTHSGATEGVLTKIEDGHYVSEITGEPGIYDEKMIMTFLYHTNYIDVSVEGAQIGLGARAFYDGKYERHQRTNEEIVDSGLNRIFEERFDLSIVRQLLTLGDDLEYFIQCFASTTVYKGETIIVISGYLPGVAPWQNGVILIRGDIIHIMITDCRGDTITLRHFTNDESTIELPAGYEDWHYFSQIRRIVHVGLDGTETERYISLPDDSENKASDEELANIGSEVMDDTAFND